MLLEKLDELIRSIMVEHSKKRFDQLLKEKKLKTKEFEKFPETITLLEEIPQEFDKNYYEQIEPLNGEEQRFIGRLDLDSLPNIKFWIRNRAKKDPFYLQGWQKDKFYPDFVALTHKGNILVFEWKGEHLLDASDIKYKEEVARVWERLGNGKLHFFLASNRKVEEILLAIKEL